VEDEQKVERPVTDGSHAELAEGERARG
jgi:hypothetical protein